MKILAIGDFHGKFPAKLKKLAKRADLVVSVGDYFPFSYRKLWFRYCYRTDVELWEIVGKKKHRAFIMKDLEGGKKTLEEVNGLGVPVISITGNTDFTKWEDAIDSSPYGWKWLRTDFFAKIIKRLKNIKIFDYSYVRVGDLVFIGMPRSTFPGKVRSKNYKKQKAKLEKLFKKFKKDTVIFVSHNAPYNTKLDKIRWKGADPQVLGKHYGSKMAQRLIKKYQPLMNISGHMHENQGRDKIGNTVLVSTGAALDGQAALIEIDEVKGKVKRIEFVK